MNKYVAILALLVVSLGVAHAQSFSLAGSNMQGNSFVVNPNSDFNVEVWYNPGAEQAHNGMYVALGYGRAGSSSGVADLDNKLSLVSWNANPAMGFNDPHTFLSPTALANPLGGGNNPFGTATGNAAARPWGIYVAYLLAPPNANNLTGPLLIGTATLHANMGFGSQYGGLVVYDQGGSSDFPGLRASGVGYANAPYGSRAGSGIYSVTTVVPEPATVLALVAGMAALARRRRK